MVASAWVTFADSKKYLTSVLVLYASLVSVKTKYPMVIMYPESYDIGKDLIGKNVKDWIARGMIKFVKVKKIDKSGNNYARKDYKVCLNKLYIWMLTEYDQVCWLDADLIVLKNIDRVMGIRLGLNIIAGASGCKCNVFNNPKLHTMPDKCPFNDKSNVYINAGLLVTRPDVNIFNMLLTQKYDYPFAEQDAFNVIFKGQIKVISSKYNYLNHLGIVHPGYKTDIHVYHFGYGKPWTKNILGRDENIYEYWRQLRRNL